MNRRVLLVDADTGFRNTLSQELGRYRVAVSTDDQGDDDTPALIVIAVEEPDKAGFKTFQKFRKALPETPIVLVTKTLSPDSFAKHRGLKVHANEYVDKRSASTEEILGKIDNLIELGEPMLDEDVAIPTDDVPMEIADGDVVLDEHLDDDQVSNFDNDMQTVGPGSGVQVDQMVEAETDAAFEALLGMDETAPAPKRPARKSSIPLPLAPVDEAIPEPVPHKIADTSDEVDSSVPVPIADSAARDDDDFDAAVTGSPGDVLARAAAAMQSDEDDFDVAVTGAQGDVLARAAAAMALESETVAQPVSTASMRHGSVPAIAIDDEELVPVEEELAVEVDVPDDSEPPQRDSPTTIAPAPVAASSERRRSVSQVDLGLDELAQRAESEQSGLYDRKSLRRVGELERQVTQLKSELERSRAAEESATKSAGRESQFLNLREQNLAKERELKDVKRTLEQHSKDLAETQEKLRQALHAKSTLEGKNAELEDRLHEEDTKQREIAQNLKAASTHGSQLEQELEAQTKARTTAEASLARAESELAAERASRAATASEAERTLRQDREQLVERHKQELAAAHAEAQEALRSALDRQHNEYSEAAAAQLEEALQALRGELGADHDIALEAMQNAHNTELLEIKTGHAGELTRVQSELGGRVRELEGAVAEAHAARAAGIGAAEQMHSQALADLTQQHESVLSEVRQKAQDDVDLTKLRSAREIEAMRGKHATELDGLKSELESQKTKHASELESLAATHATELEGLTAQYVSELEGLKTQHTNEVDGLTAKHEAELEARDEEHAQVREREAEANARGVADLKSQLDRAGASHHEQLVTSQRQHDQLVAQHASEKAELERQRDEHIANLSSQHDEERRVHAHALASEQDQRRSEIAAVQQRHDALIAEHRSTAARELEDVREELSAARKAAEDAATRADAARAELERAHATALSERDAKHERALATANGEHSRAKAASDAEHGKQLAALRAELDAANKALAARAHELEELAGERDALDRGLSGAREQLAKANTELQQHVKTIGDRNAEVRQGFAAVAERDQRINELRGEISSLEQENAGYQDQVLRAYQKIKSDEAMVARARKAMAIALTVLDDQGNPKEQS